MIVATMKRMLITAAKWVEYLINKRGIKKELIPRDSFPEHFNYNPRTYLQDS